MRWDVRYFNELLVFLNWWGRAGSGRREEVLVKKGCIKIGLSMYKNSAKNDWEYDTIRKLTPQSPRSYSSYFKIYWKVGTDEILNTTLQAKVRSKLWKSDETIDERNMNLKLTCSNPYFLGVCHVKAKTKGNNDLATLIILIIWNYCDKIVNVL